jgi:archaeosortase B (VPXXXP-CTERM-specific)
MESTLKPNARSEEPAGKRPSFSGFVARLFLYLFAVSLMFSLGGLHLRLQSVQNAFAAVVAAGAGQLGADSTLHGSIIRLSGASLEINHECTGIFVLLVYATFVLAYPATWLQRAAGVLTGLLVLTAVNLARLVLLTVIASQRPNWFAYFHEYFFQGVFIALLAFLASVWTERVRRATVGHVPG